MKFEINTKSIKEVKDLSRKLSSQIQKGDVICLKGDLGTGKTYLAKHIIQNLLGKDTNVTSPTFQLLQTYDYIHHYDLYRLKSSEEIYEIGLEDSLDGNRIVIIEWPEIIEHMLPEDIIEIQILIDRDSRKYLIYDRSGRLKW